jgi:hypothetical protein
VRRNWRIAIGAVFVGIILIASLSNLDRIPAPWWDEGWTMNLAKNWVERGWYGQLLNGEPAPPGLSASFPTVALVALSFKLLGIGVWQGRLATVSISLLVLVLIYWLGFRLYSRKVAMAALVLLVILAPYPFLSPVYVGRQVLAEMPMLFFLLIGYAAFWLVMRRSRWWLLVTMVAWGIALVAKAQTLPFWAASLLVPLSLMLVRRHWTRASLLIVALIGSCTAMVLLLRMQGLILNGRALSSAPMPGIYEVTGWVLNISARQEALIRVVLLGLPTLLGLLYGVQQCWQSVQRGVEQTDRNLLRLMLLSLAGTWFVWYLCLSIGFERYLFPAVFIGSMFTAAALADATEQFDLPRMVRRLRDDLHQHRPGRSTLWLGTMAAALLVTLPQIGLTLVSNFLPSNDSPLAEVSAFLNRDTSPMAVIESYDTEIFVQLDRSYHYPPDALSLAAISRTLLMQDTVYNYDPLTANPDYLVVGSFVRAWHIYDAVIASGQFKRVYDNDRYEVYQRVR